MTVTNIGHRSTTAPYEELDVEHARWWDSYGDWALLLIIAAGDFASFSIVMQLANANSEWYINYALVFAMTSAAVLLMHTAGKMRRNVKAGTAPHGKSAVWLVVACWLGLGLSAFWMRLTAPEPAVASGDDFGFGAAATESTAHTPALTMAVVLIALFLAGGVAAFFIGYLSHHPERRKAMREKRLRNKAIAAERALADEQRRNEQILAERKVEARIALNKSNCDRVANLEAQLQDERRALNVKREVALARLVEIEAQIAVLTQQASLTEGTRNHKLAIIAAGGAELKELARVNTAVALHQPAKTSGVFHNPAYEAPSV